jgi:hypothetical protein
MQKRLYYSQLSSSASFDKGWQMHGSSDRPSQDNVGCGLHRLGGELIRDQT